MLTRLTDKLVLCPTRHPIPAPGKTRRLIEFGGGHVEAWTHRCGCDSTETADLFVLKFPGTGGRAERATDHPADFWSDLGVELWAFNPPGYGCSSGRASLRNLAGAATAAFDAVRETAGDRPVVVMGNSLGTTAAMHVAAVRNADALILRNVIPPRQLIIGQHAWWSLYVGAALVARGVPEDLDAIALAERVNVPAVFVMSGKDGTVPPPYQRRVIDAYAGDKRVLLLAEADHATGLTPGEQRQYAGLLSWLRERALGL